VRRLGSHLDGQNPGLKLVFGKEAVIGSIHRASMSGQRGDPSAVTQPQVFLVGRGGASRRTGARSDERPTAPIPGLGIVLIVRLRRTRGVPRLQAPRS
jgi:hypothetical protein